MLQALCLVTEETRSTGRVSDTYVRNVYVQVSVRTHAGTYVRACVRTYVPTTYVRRCVRMYVRTYVRTDVRTYVPYGRTRTYESVRYPAVPETIAGVGPPPDPFTIGLAPPCPPSLRDLAELPIRLSTGFLGRRLPVRGFSFTHALLPSSPPHSSSPNPSAIPAPAPSLLPPPLAPANPHPQRHQTSQTSLGNTRRGASRVECTRAKGRGVEEFDGRA